MALLQPKVPFWVSPVPAETPIFIVFCLLEWPQKGTIFQKQIVATKMRVFLTCFRASFFPFCPLCWPPLFLPFSRHLFALVSPSKSALFCREKGTSSGAAPGCTSPQSSGRKFLPEICVKKGQLFTVWTQIVFAYFLKNDIFTKKHSQPHKKHYFSWFFWCFPFPLFFMLSFLLFSNIKKRQNKKCTFCFEDPFFDTLTNCQKIIFAPVHTICVF